MTPQEVRELFLPQEEEQDPRFARQIDHLSVLGLRIIAGVCLSGVLYFTVAGIFVPTTLWNAPGGALVPVSILALGLASLGMSFWSRVDPHARWVGMAIGYGVALAQIVGTSSVVETAEVSYLLTSGIISGVMLIGTAALPFKPVHALVLGGSILATYGVALPWITPRGQADYGFALVYVAQSLVVCIALTAIVYRQRVLAYRGRRAAREALQELRNSQARLLVSENAHAQSRFAAALSHELNTPLGALVSAFDTVLHVFRKEGLASDPRYAEILAGAEAAGRGSAGRLQATVQRMSYLTNLDRAEEQSTDMNELCRQTTALLGPDVTERAELRLHLGDVPRIRCRPQQVTAVLGNLLRNSAAAVGERGEIHVTTLVDDEALVVEVRDNGRGMSRDTLDHLFEPSFRVEHGRVATTNWSLFVCRTIVLEHGGDLEVESELGRGTTARIRLPSLAVRTKAAPPAARA